MMNENNHKAVKYLRELGYPLPDIRKALHVLSGMTQPEIAERLAVSRQTVTSTMKGARTNLRVQARLAALWGVPPEMVFEEWQNLLEEAEVSA